MSSVLILLIGRYVLGGWAGEGGLHKVLSTFHYTNAYISCYQFYMFVNPFFLYSKTKMCVCVVQLYLYIISDGRCKPVGFYNICKTNLWLFTE